MVNKELEDLKARLHKISTKEEPKTKAYTKVKQMQPKIPPKPVQPQKRVIQPEEEVEEPFEDEIKQWEEEEEAMTQQPQPNEEYVNEEYVNEEITEEDNLPPLATTKTQKPLYRPLPPVQPVRPVQRPQSRPLQQQIPQQTPRPQPLQQQQMQPSEADMEKFREQLTSEIIRLIDSGQFAVEIIFQLNRLNTNIENLINALAEEE